MKKEHKELHNCSSLLDLIYGDTPVSTTRKCVETMNYKTKLHLKHDGRVNRHVYSASHLGHVKSGSTQHTATKLVHL